MLCSKCTKEINDNESFISFYNKIYCKDCCTCYKCGKNLLTNLNYKIITKEDKKELICFSCYSDE